MHDYVDTHYSGSSSNRPITTTVGISIKLGNDDSVCEFVHTL